ncbi:MAG: 16S rRNA (guanine(966)-N(2))-methyltransferase RsmD [Spirulinaceae cyanobacterium SM2_1_0]|nr:16S rRNA (guanine(966)-N(2))-methyltransferase RsmD [Spirulinaceae cyanobacterium SM2_1_0]
MRIYGNRQLKTLPGQATRPTTARVREAVFNIWQGEIAGCRWLDLCAGNGTMGAEALCRGAATVVGIEQAGRACQISRHNWQQVARVEQEWRILRGDVRQRLLDLSGQVFDRIYFDPPYDSGLYETVIAAIATEQILAPDGELAVEYSADCWQAGAIASLAPSRHKHYSRTSLVFYRWATPPAAIT